ncbi:hypothetical protein HPB50_024019 [Hyalomma asiaticum]|uniref:Uncharacterized protein n=1 Tax=Hyalomma asiaticum TaxID=266040 RepID=A0ACB7T129_HYAAI|nr:hypothetical protein HPB50_024019 [Hyalomma asiaticum]
MTSRTKKPGQHQFSAAYVISRSRDSAADRVALQGRLFSVVVPRTTQLRATGGNSPLRPLTAAAARFRFNFRYPPASGPPSEFPCLGLRFLCIE